MSHFEFVTNDVLRSNLDTTFLHLVDLLILSESDTYKKEEKELLVSSLRKTIIIHTSSIVEALLFWKLRQLEKANKVELPDDWRYVDVKILYEVNNSEQIVAGKRKKESRKIDAIDFKHVIDLCKENAILDTALKTDLHKMRGLRNRQHLGNLTTLEEQYTKGEMEFCFGLAKKVKELVAE